jgi:hypothetical protein
MTSTSSGDRRAGRHLLLKRNAQSGSRRVGAHRGPGPAVLRAQSLHTIFVSVWDWRIARKASSCCRAVWRFSADNYRKGRRASTSSTRRR